MHAPSNQHEEPRSMEEEVKVLLSNARQDIRERYQRCQNRIRKSPTSSVLSAVATGYFLHRLPVRAILLTQVRVLSALTPPALFLYGAAKLYEVLHRHDMAEKK